ncbi:RmlC-like cupin domain-containing protein [Penicillium sp. IBT 18751x]|nr:RmlC-like cupin domain-containing protein [Penicillium sp. IBT 18751x]
MPPIKQTAPCPCKRIVNFRIKFPPDGSVTPYRYGRSLVSAYVMSITLFKKIDHTGLGIKVCNASKTERAILFAKLVLDSDMVETDGVERLIQMVEDCYYGCFRKGIWGHSATSEDALDSVEDNTAL